MKLAHYCLLGCLVLGGGTAFGGGERMFFIPVDEDPSNTTPGENFVVQGLPGETITIAAFVENIADDVNATQVGVFCSYTSSTDGGDLSYVANSTSVDTNRSDYILAGAAGFPALDQGQCDDSIACTLPEECPGNSTCLDGTCTIVRPRAGIVALAAVSVSGAAYIGEFDFTIPNDAAGEYTFLPSCTEKGTAECTAIDTSISTVNGTIPFNIDGLTIQLPGPALEILHEDGLDGQTRPFTGYIDPRGEANNDSSPAGITSINIRFNGPAFGSPQGFDLTTFNFFVEQSDGNPAPDVTGLTDLDGDRTYFQVDFDRPFSTQVWTTIRVVAFDSAGNQIADNGNQGPGVDEVDRVDIGFLPCDVDQNGQCSPLDLFRFRVLVNNTMMQPDQGTREDFLDMNRDGLIFPTDLFRFRQLVNGVPPATQSWSLQSIGSRP